MDDIDDEQDPDELDMAQLLVREAGKLIEDCYDDFALMLPTSAALRSTRLSAMASSVQTALSLLAAAIELEQHRIQADTAD